MTPKTPKPATEVIFRVSPEGGTLALFPAIPATTDPGLCLCWDSVSGHGSACIRWASALPPASKSATVSACAALEGWYGYKVKVMRRFLPRHRSARISEIRNQHTATSHPSPV